MVTPTEALWACASIRVLVSSILHSSGLVVDSTEMSGALYDPDFMVVSLVQMIVTTHTPLRE